VATTKLPQAPHRDKFRANAKEITRLLEIHSEISGSGPGYKHNVEVLNKSAIVLLVATWECYVEDLASNAFDFLLSNCNNHLNIPRKILAQTAKKLIDSKNELDVWELAGKGWVSVLGTHKSDAINKYITTLNTPKTRNVDDIFESLLGIRSISDKWCWRGMSKSSAVSKLEGLIKLRGEIAHKVSVPKHVSKAKVVEYKNFLGRLATISHNRCAKHLLDICGKQPWRTYRYAKTK